jgi:hypothetical protein
MAIPETIRKLANDIRTKIYGREVRESLAQGIEEAGNIADQTRERQDSVEALFQSVLDETTGKDVNSAPEILAARVSADGTQHSNLKKRLDAEHSQLSAQLTQTESNIGLTNLVAKDNIPSDHLKENISFGVSSFGIFFDGINSPETTIRDLFLKNNTNYILSARVRGNGERIRFQSYPDGAFISQDFVVENDGVIEYEFNTGDITVTQIKVVQVDTLIGNEIIVTDILLREKRIGKYVKSDRELALNLMNAVNLKKPNRIIDGRSNSIYNAFSSGVRFQGKEYYVFRQGTGHHTPSDPTKWGKLVLLEREPNTLNFKVVDEIIETDYEPRDPNLSVSRDGLKMFLSFAATADEVNYNNYYYVYEWTMVRSSRITISEGDNVFSWGNMIQTPNGYLIKAGYTTQNAGLAPVYQSVLYRSNNNNPNDPQGFTRITIASIAGEECTETTLGYWRNYLVAMIRNKVGFSLVLTQDLEGQTGWSTPQRHTTLTLHAPCLMQYNKSDEDLYFTASYYKSASDRKPVFGCIRKPNKFMNAIRANQIKTVVLDEKTGTGGYTTLVPLSDSKFGVMYYRDEQGWTGASLFFMEVDKNMLAKLDTDYYDKNIWNNKGSVTNFCSDALSYEFAFIDVINIPTNSTEYDFTYTYKEPATYDILYAEGFVVNRPNIEMIPKLPGKDYCIFTLKSKDGSYIPASVTVRLKITKQMSA